MKSRNLISAAVTVLAMCQSLLAAGMYPDFTSSIEPTTNYPTDSNGNSLFSPFTPPVQTLSVDPEAPQVAEWSRESQPGDTMVLVGEKISLFSDTSEGKDTGVHFYGADQNVQDGYIERLDGRECAVTLPSNLISDSAYLMWVSNNKGCSEPVALNTAELWWVGFDQISRGDTFYVYGRNLKLGDGDCHLFYTNEVSGAGGWLKSGAANPYKVTFVMPSNVAAGNYTIYVHNGHGQKYGWSEPASLVVKDPYVWSGKTYNLVTDFGANGADGQDDQAAFDACKAAVNANKGSTVIIPAGTYHLSGTFDLRSDTRFIGAGISNTILTATNVRSATGDDIFIVGRESYVFKDMSIRLTESLKKDAIRINETWSKDVWFENIEIDDRASPETNHGVLNLNKATRVSLKNCYFYHKNTVNFGQAHQVRVEGCHFIGIYDNNQLATINSGAQVDFSRCVARNLSTGDTSSSYGWCKGRWIVDTGRSRDLYLEGNETQDLLPRNPSEFWKGGVVTAIGPYENEQNYFYGNFGEQVISVTDVPDEYHGFGDDSIPYSGGEAVLQTSHGEDEFLIRKTDAINNTITIQLIDWRTPLVYEPGMTIGLKDITDGNASEQYLLEGNASRFEGKPISVTADELVFNSGTLDNLSACTVAHIVKGQGWGQFRRIESVDEATGTVKLVSPWRVPPTTDSIINMGGYAHRYVFYRNTFDGRPEGADPNGYSASAGMQSGGGSSEMIFVDNSFNEVRQGLWFRSKGNFDTYPDVNVMSQNIFNYVKGNHFRNCMLDIALSTSSKGGKSIRETDLCSVGNVLRGNDSSGAYRAFSISPTDDANAYWVKMNVFQDNVASDFSTSIYEEQGVVNQVWIGNEFTGNGSGIGYKIAENHVPVLRNNSWAGFFSTYGGDEPGGVLELPIRTAILDEQLTGIQVPVWNCGSSAFSWSVESVVTENGSSWLTASVVGSADLAANGGAGWLSLALSGSQLPANDVSATVTIVAGEQRKTMTVIYSTLPSSPDDYVVEYEVTYDFEVQAVLSNMTTDEEVVLEVMQSPSNYKLRIPRNLTVPGNTYQVIFKRRSIDNPNIWVHIPDQTPNFRM